MSENTEQGGAPATPPTSEKPKIDVVAAFKGLHAAEKLLFCAAVATLLGFIIGSGWDALFKYRWFPTCAFLGAVLVLVAIVLDIFGVKFVDAKVRIWILVVLAILPVLGFVIDQLSMPFGYVLMLAGAIVMGLAGVKITTREQIIKT